ncbi:CPBP family glutamic-type intramembrane protease [Lysinibacillus louembei]|uniref:CPBP family glutamic-type intramembrane protease n=1 Tax=Lysinibacillus louembei TaxID=1470088 RepID=A0ABZ0S1R9_9BACI|nr:CPBP family glutamic-type intramembrane protease [Lysinibacillus louembei]WPK13619.1 CPBP family glutamic-type intramembrane protease [Lysinibacillus louembei]
MFNWVVFITLVSISIPGTIISSILLNNKTASGKREVPVIVAIILQLVFLSVFVALGVALINKISLPTENIFISSWIEAALVGIGCSITHILIYYVFFRPLLGKAFYKIEKHRNSIGIANRILYASVVEELIFRWGIMSLLLWLTQSFLTEGISVATSVVVSSLIFTLAHYQGSSIAGKSFTLYSYIFIGNMLVGIICGWQFYNNGIIAAILVHMCFHLILYPFEVKVLKSQLNNLSK